MPKRVEQYYRKDFVTSVRFSPEMIEKMGFLKDLWEANASEVVQECLHIAYKKEYARHQSRKK